METFIICFIWNQNRYYILNMTTKNTKLSYCIIFKINLIKLTIQKWRTDHKNLRLGHSMEWEVPFHDHENGLLWNHVIIIIQLNDDEVLPPVNLLSNVDPLSAFVLLRPFRDFLSLFPKFFPSPKNTILYFIITASLVG
jgi:hypothetical protein